MKCKFWQKRGWPYIVGGLVGILLIIGGTMLLDTATENPYQGYQNSSGNENAPATITIEVAPALEECTGVGPQQCMLIREVPPAGDGVWKLFYDQIEGFTYEEGYVWTLRVNVTETENPPADASNLHYALAEVVDKKPVL
ncbi:DUF4377 domain-containing protein [Methanogenium organophilum]|uniref:DUF4377 domain-containing protein n=1 Tax=Methanogenium organophilum TaxID=2199 RepID=A0A9X9T9H5_METOG|nr:DUF4377 domain-containing protein [Methanogenium organophilum]WAI02112.1 DUF4377 domain-containing protein [Methanogenium organophilum]